MNIIVRIMNVKGKPSIAAFKSALDIFIWYAIIAESITNISFVYPVDFCIPK